jgi:nucleoside-diphosphate-sugar epimerase
MVLVSYLKDRGLDVFFIDIVPRIDVDYNTADINNPFVLTPVFRSFEPEVVYHLAGIVSRIVCERSPSLTIRTNVTGTYNIVQLCRTYHAKLIFFSTSEVYGNIEGPMSEERQDLHPNNLYAISKYLAEKLVLYEMANGLEAIIVRPFMIYHENEKTGENHSAVIRFTEALIKRQKIEVHKGSIRPWTYIADAVELFEKLLYVKNIPIVNISNPKNIKTEDLAALICEYLNICYENHIVEITLPERMTLRKIPDLTLQNKLTNKKSFICLEEGIERIINKISD